LGTQPDHLTSPVARRRPDGHLFSGTPETATSAWSEVATLETIEQVAHLIDRLARRIEDAVDRGLAGSGETPLTA